MSSSVFSFLGSLSSSVYTAVASALTGYGIKSYLVKKEQSVVAALKADVKAAHTVLSGAANKVEAEAKADMAKVIAFLSKWL